MEPLLDRIRSPGALPGGPLAAAGVSHAVIAGLLAVAGFALPFAIVHGIGSYSAWDLKVFEDWAGCWGQEIYPACRPNYPAIGLMLSAGVIHVIDTLGAGLDRETVRLLFRDYLAVFDALNFLLFIALARSLRLSRPVAVALGLAVTPSTWVGGAHWGQIDNVGLFFCLLATMGFIRSWQALEDHRQRAAGRRAAAWQWLAWLSLALYLLSKQLAIFSVPFFLLLALLTLRFSIDRLRWLGLGASLAGMAFFLLAFRYFDTLFRVPEGFHDSSYWFVWTSGGSDHANQISRNGFNIWMFLGRDMESSSHANFLNFQIWKWRDHLSPYKAGLILYFLYVAGLLAVTMMRVLRGGPALMSKSGGAPGHGNLIAVLLLFHALCHLGFNVLLSGTHERYLYLGYPYLLMAAWWFFTGRRGFGGRLTAFCFLAAAAYGGFVFSVNGSLSPLLFPLRRPEFLASLHLFLLVALTDRYLQLLRQKPPGVSAAAPAALPIA